MPSVNSQVKLHFAKPSYTSMPRNYEPNTYRTKEVQRDEREVDREEEKRPLISRCKYMNKIKIKYNVLIILCIAGVEVVETMVTRY